MSFGVCYVLESESAKYESWPFFSFYTVEGMHREKRFKGIILYNGATGGSKDVTNSIVSDNKKSSIKFSAFLYVIMI